MTKEQIEHYRKGGVFMATYMPKVTSDLRENVNEVGKRLKVWQNVISSILVTPKEYEGQFPFNADEVYGWIPEQDLDNLEMIDEFYESIVPYGKRYLYRLYHNTQESVNANFGKGYTAPMVVGRQYASQIDDYVMKLSSPQADKIERAVWNGEQFDELKWDNML